MKPVDVVFLWHMHQPDYRDHGAGGEYRLPWVYLHAVKDYCDMAAHLERHPHVRCVVNFVPVLLDQIDDYCAQFASGHFRDPLLRLLGTADLDHIDDAARTLLLDTCFSANHDHMLKPFPHYLRLHRLHQLVREDGPPADDYLSGAYLGDLLTWYHLAWTGEAARRSDPLIARLMSKGQGFSHADRLALRAALGTMVASVLPRWRALAARGQVELSATPHTHPLAPLLLDLHCAREALPTAPLPLAEAYPGGRSRVEAQIASARDAHARRFGTPPLGLWPAEGALSTAFAAQLAAAGTRWAASGEGVLRNSLGNAADADANAPYRPWQLAAAPGLTLFFRDDALSDRIGFDYARWHGRDAAADLVSRIEAIAAAADGAPALVSIVLDGENAWETYPYNGYYFFDDLYGLLREHPAIRTTTYADVLADPAHRPAELPTLVAGSWVYGTLSTWIGEAAKNRAWDLLCAAKKTFDLIASSARLDPAQLDAATRQLAVCESSDWFWWLSDSGAGEAAARFDALFRHNLAELYRCLQLDPPAVLAQPLCAPASTASTDGTMRRSTAPAQP